MSVLGGMIAAGAIGYGIGYVAKKVLGIKETDIVRGKTRDECYENVQLKISGKSKWRIKEYPKQVGDYWEAVVEK